MRVFWKLLASANLAFIVVSCAPPVTPAPKVQTTLRLKHVYYAMRVLEAENRLPIGEQLRQVSEGTTLEEKWAFLLIDSVGSPEMKPKYIKEQLCRDGYGNLFNVNFKANLTAGGASSVLKQTSFDVVVWSSGRNGINEFGNGDDVVLLLPAGAK